MSKNFWASKRSGSAWEMQMPVRRLPGETFDSILTFSIFGSSGRRGQSSSGGGEEQPREEQEPPSLPPSFPVPSRFSPPWDLFSHFSHSRTKLSGPPCLQTPVKRSGDPSHSLATGKAQSIAGRCAPSIAPCSTIRCNRCTSACSNKAPSVQIIYRRMFALLLS